MTTLIFYALICSGNVCTAYEPASWVYFNEEERIQMLHECSVMVNAFDSLPMVKETDCFIAE